MEEEGEKICWKTYSEEQEQLCSENRTQTYT